MKRICNSATAIAVIFASFAASAFAAGGANGGKGGVALECEADLRGTYFLDYILTNDIDLAPMKGVDSLETMVERTRSIIEKHLPLLLESYDSFFDSYFTPSSRPGRQWSQSNEPLPTNDQELDYEAQVKLRKYAPDCLDGMRQAFVRNQAGGVIYYTYNPDIRTALALTGWLQLSYALHHEWLRDHVNDPHQVRELNRVLHSGVMDDSAANLCEIFREAHACNPVTSHSAAHARPNAVHASKSMAAPLTAPRPTLTLVPAFAPPAPPAERKVYCTEEHRSYSQFWGAEEWHSFGEVPDCRSSVSVRCKNCHEI